MSRVPTFAALFWVVQTASFNATEIRIGDPEANCTAAGKDGNAEVQTTLCLPSVFAKNKYERLSG